MRLRKVGLLPVWLLGWAVVPVAVAQQDHPVLIVAYNYVPGQSGAFGLASQTTVPLMISEGDTVTAIGLDVSPNGPHTITADAVDPVTNLPLFDSDPVGFMESKSVNGAGTLGPGRYPFHCRFHLFMHGVITVQ